MEFIALGFLVVMVFALALWNIILRKDNLRLWSDNCDVRWRLYQISKESLRWKNQHTKHDEIHQFVQSLAGYEMKGTNEWISFP